MLSPNFNVDREPMTQDEILARLTEGNARFVADGLNRPLQDQSRRAELSTYQKPWAIVLSCADSRVVPEFAFDTGLGELFTVRVAGNTANTSSIASIEYAVAHLKTSIIVVLGHESCGAVTAAVKGGDNGYNLNHLLAHIEPAKTKGGDAAINEVVKGHAKQTVDELQARSSILSGAVGDGALKIVPAYYQLGTGKVDWLN